jgi:hypothetical protein
MKPFYIATTDIHTMETYASVVDCATNKALTPRTQPVTASLLANALDAEPTIAEPARDVLRRHYGLRLWERDGRRVI